MSFRAGIEKEFRIAIRDWKALLLALLLPIVAVFLFSQIGSDTTNCITQAGLTADTRALVLSLAIMFPALLVSSSAVVREKVAGTLTRLAKTPVSVASFVVSKFVALAFVVVLQSVVLLVASAGLLPQVPLADVPGFILVLVFLGWGVLALGVFLSTIVSTDSQAGYMASLMAIAMITLCGFIRPLSELGAMGEVSAAIPYTQGYQGLFNYFCGTFSLAAAALPLLITTGVLLGLAMLLLRLRLR